jgi:dienelactone hydrolase
MEEFAVKRIRTMLCLIIGIVMTCVVSAYAATWEDATGPYPTATVGDAGPGNGYTIYRPQTLKPNAHPIAVLCVGSGAHPRNYDALLTSLASHGVVVIASTDPYQSDGSKAIAGVDWLFEQNEMRNSEFYQKLNLAKVLAIGHSAGGNGAMMASTKSTKVTSLLLYAPAVGNANASDLLVPTFFIAGSLDQTVYPDYVKARFQDAKRAHAWYGESADQGHTGFARNLSIQYYTRGWVYTHLFDDTGTARECFYGPNWTFKKASTWKETLRNNSAS